MPEAPGLGRELLDRWAEAHREYHTPTHLLAVLEALDLLLEPSDDSLRGVVLLAGWFHDAVYEGRAGADERASAALAVQRLGGIIPDDAVRDVERLVLLTATHDPAPEDRAGHLLCDADLAVLAGTPAEYARYAAAIRAEYRDVPRDAFTDGRRAVLHRLLTLEPLYRTPRAQAEWTGRARANLAHELASL